MVPNYVEYRRRLREQEAADDASKAQHVRESHASYDEIISDGTLALEEGYRTSMPLSPQEEMRGAFDYHSRNIDQHFASASQASRLQFAQIEDTMLLTKMHDLKIATNKRKIAELEQQIRNDSICKEFDRLEARMVVKTAAHNAVYAAQRAIAQAEEAEAAAEKAESDAALGAGTGLGELRRRPLTADEEDLVQNALHGPGGTEAVVQEMFNIPIKRKDMQSLRPVTWLNDEVINFWMELLSQRTNVGGTKTAHFFNTFFTTKLCEGGYCFRNVRRWTKKFDIFALDKVVMPVHVGQMHWCLAVIFMRTKTIRYYDSMAGPGHALLDNLKQYLVDEAKHKKDETLDPSEWTTVTTVVSDTPQQNNGCDCGVFTCMAADHIAADEPLSYSQADMPHFRRRMMIRILQGKLEEPEE